jgi:hypothetical protein
MSRARRGSPCLLVGWGGLVTAIAIPKRLQLPLSACGSAGSPALACCATVLRLTGEQARELQRRHSKVPRMMVSFVPTAPDSQPWPTLINTYAGVAESDRDGSTPDQLAKSMLDGRRVCGHGRSPVERLAAVARDLRSPSPRKREAPMWSPLLRPPRSADLAHRRSALTIRQATVRGFGQPGRMPDVMPSIRRSGTARGAQEVDDVSMRSWIGGG